MKPSVLILDDEPAIGSSLRFALENTYDVQSVTRVEEAREILKQQPIHLLILDWRLGEVDGLDVLEEVKREYPSISVIMMTAYGTIESSVEAMKRGAYHYITKPLDIDELHLLIEKALEHQALHSKIRELNETIDRIKGYDQMIGESPAMKKVFSIIEQVKDIDSSVLIYGESGTGKELVARALHRQGKRKDKPFISVNCAAIPEALLESELFGYAKGAFTGAVSSREGKLAAAAGGTLFLDEIGDMPSALQAKMLRVLQEKEYMPLGSTEIKKVDVRIISATNKDLQQMVKERAFREDLFFRLNVIPIELPLLRERKEDLRTLIPYFLKKYAEDMQRPMPVLSEQAWERLLAYDYPGNIRELSNILEYTVAMTRRENIDEEDLPLVVRSDKASKKELDHHSSDYIKIPFGATMKEAERLIIEEVLKQCNDSRKETAQLLGISERSLRNKLQLYRESNK
ncbi:sigma-54-dependent transcriptional regulator [Bacillus thermotolerans]|uniref:Response regulator of zinc sigma-54-dependent two-component system n=1 Tax=Bacillus thermotolerans TaxID=1221996 RepID=A0A0F5I2D1_BACTR|nr:sigma-54 dependent transcriptional regulator [Bacillus thermotolerans]KKB38273.1 Response regulator of zinc sigma-54-dependent two-component system [Bacillus thermotolerans]KKB39819.1 Response regulator of zinc sigma-54-dependent two-component system [Bacillus thermotolerans]KKB44257.1 Response regulator of zinc sigma-54-dependent two-component system [Bacillus thermotolerans]